MREAEECWKMWKEEEVVLSARFVMWMEREQRDMRDGREEMNKREEILEKIVGRLN